MLLTRGGFEPLGKRLKVPGGLGAGLLGRGAARGEFTFNLTDGLEFGGRGRVARRSALARGGLGDVKRLCDRLPDLCGMEGALAGLSFDQVQSRHPQADGQRQEQQDGPGKPRPPPADGDGASGFNAGGDAFGLTERQFDEGGLDAGGGTLAQFDRRAEAIAQFESAIELLGGTEPRPGSCECGDGEGEGNGEDGRGDEPGPAGVEREDRQHPRRRDDHEAQCRPGRKSRAAGADDE